jgi:uncharacterized protein with FMN-binding domain
MRHRRAAALSALASGVILAAGWGAMLVRTTDAVQTSQGVGAAATPPGSGGTTPGSGSGSGASGGQSGSSSGIADGAFTGAAVGTVYGTVQVAVTIVGGAVTEVQALQLPSGDGKSQQISNRAEPVLRAEALQAQSASIRNVSGATYTSRGYVQSLQAALDQAAQR